MINLRSKLHLALLGYYFANPEGEHYVRELSRMLSVDVAQLSQELNLLTSSGIFVSSLRGREKYFRINRGHRLYGNLKKITMFFVDKKSTNKK